MKEVLYHSWKPTTSFYNSKYVCDCVCVCVICFVHFQCLVHKLVQKHIPTAAIHAIHFCASWCLCYTYEWYAMVGNSTDDRQLHISRDSGLGVSSPKHGKVCNKHYNCTICHCVDPLLLLNVMLLLYFSFLKTIAFSRH